MSETRDSGAEWAKAMAELEEKHGTGITADGAAIVRQKKDSVDNLENIKKETRESVCGHRAQRFVEQVSSFGREDVRLHVADLSRFHDITVGGEDPVGSVRRWLDGHLRQVFDLGFDRGAEASRNAIQEDTVSAERHQEIGERRAILWAMELLGFHPQGKEDDFRVATIKLKEELPLMIGADRRIAFDDGAKSVRKKIEDYLRNRELRLDQAVEECAKIEEQMAAAQKKKEDLKSEMAALIEVASMISEPDRE